MKSLGMGCSVNVEGGYEVIKPRLMGAKGFCLERGQELHEGRI